MAESKNIPYRKKYDENGKLVNVFPYLTNDANRFERRISIQKQRHRGNHNGNSIVIVRESLTVHKAYKRLIQFVKGFNKPIMHYIQK